MSKNPLRDHRTGNMISVDKNQTWIFLCYFRVVYITGTSEEIYEAKIMIYDHLGIKDRLSAIELDSSSIVIPHKFAATLEMEQKPKCIDIMSTTGITIRFQMY